MTLEQQRTEIRAEYAGWAAQQAGHSVPPLCFEDYLMAELGATRGLLRTAKQRIKDARAALSAY